MTQYTDLSKVDAEILLTVTQHHLKYSIGRQFKEPSIDDVYHALALSLRQYAAEQAHFTEARVKQSGSKRMYYLSMEFLVGRLLSNNMINLGLEDSCRKVIEHFGYQYDDIEEIEPDPALGNGGLGRLAACFLDSLATLNMPGYGYGINYEYGLFKQSFDNGHQQEQPDNWLANGTPWQREKTDELLTIPVYGRVTMQIDDQNNLNPTWQDCSTIVAIPNDLPVIGFGGNTVNYLRLYSARSSDQFDITISSSNDYLRALEQKIQSENISKVLYPPDASDDGKELRLLQEYFLVACSLRDIISKFFTSHNNIKNLHEHIAIQLNDTHPALCVPELMRTLVDDHRVPWENAWHITQNTLSYTNHTLLPEALERWPVYLLEKVLPRHLQIIYEINRRFLIEVTEKFPQNSQAIRDMSIIEEGDPKQVKMANLAIIGSHSVNGVAALHTELIKSDLVPYFHEMWPNKINNKTNGVTQRRWLYKCNPELSTLITKHISDQWITNLDELKKLEKFTDNTKFLNDFIAIKQTNKIKLSKYIAQTSRIDVDPNSIFDVQIKRIHEYKRQLLNVFYIIHSYLSLVEDGIQPTAPRTWIFSGKAAPGYYMAKNIIKLINNISEYINNDPKANGFFKVVFIPDYRVSIAEKIIPAADLSEQISTAGFEASGTGNMKLSMNGALTIGTLDGANVEILEEVGEENIYIFGLTVDEVADLRRKGYNPWDLYQTNSKLSRVIDALNSDRFCPSEPGHFKPIFDSLMQGGDYFLLLADFLSYIETQEAVSQDFLNQKQWAHKAILNIARIGKFSSDRTIREYAQDIWNINPTIENNSDLKKVS